MGYVQRFKYDIFISYAHQNNKPMKPGSEGLGWVDYFQDQLCNILRDKLSGEVAIFRDPKLNGYENFSDQLAEALQQSAVLISILSPRYIQSVECLKELRKFTEMNADKPANCKGRVLKVVKSNIEGKTTALDGQVLLANIKELIEHRFYRKDERTGEYEDLNPVMRSKDVEAFYEVVEDVANDLEKIFRLLRPASGPLSLPASAPAMPLAPVPTPAAVAPAPNPLLISPSVPPPPPTPEQHRTNSADEAEKPTVYLAEPAKDQVENHKLIKLELLQFKFRVLPDQPLPANVKEYDQAVQRYLEQAQLSVHLLGESYGEILDIDDEERSTPHVQYDLAVALAQAGKLTQLVWLPPGLTLKPGGKQDKLVTQVKNSSREYLQVKLEDLKTEIHNKLKPPPKDIWAELAGDPVTVCLFCHEQDFAQVGPLFSYLKLEEAYKVKLPLQDQEPPEKYKQLLQSSDAVLLYYGAADEEWFSNMWRVIQKLSTTGRTKPLAAKAIYIGECETKEKSLLSSSDPLVLKNYAPFTPEIIAPFIQRIRAVTEGR